MYDYINQKTSFETLFVFVSPLMFLFIADEDIKLNSTVFHWPEHIKTVFELSQSRILNRREHAEDETKKKVAAFEERLNDYQKEVDSFRKKEVNLHKHVTVWDLQCFTIKHMHFTIKQSHIWLKVVPFEWYCPLVRLIIKWGIERCPLVVTNVK